MQGQTLYLLAPVADLATFTCSVKKVSGGFGWVAQAGGGGGK